MLPDRNLFKVIVDPQDRCAVWPADLPTPSNWREIGIVGNRAAADDFLEYLLASAARMRRWFEQGMQKP